MIGTMDELLSSHRKAIHEERERKLGKRSLTKVLKMKMLMLSSSFSGFKRSTKPLGIEKRKRYRKKIQTKL